MQAEKLDPRIHPYKDDVAASHLQGRVEAERFVEGVLHRVQSPITDILSDKSGRARTSQARTPQARTSQALYGEAFMVYQTAGDWAWGQLLTDHYVGWVRTLALGADGNKPTHRIISPLTRATDASIKVLGHGPLPMGAQLHVRAPDIEVGGSSAPFAQTEAGAIPAAHLTSLDRVVSDWVAVAEMFLHVPYVWGGRSAMGIDCSALIQLALQQACIPCPRDSDMQEDALGHALDQRDTLKRGDLIFWPGHVGVMVDGANMLHANAYAMATAMEPLADVEARIGAARTMKRLR